MRRWLDELSAPAGFAALAVIAGAVGYYLMEGEFDLTMRGLTALGILLLGFFFYANSAAIRGRVGARQVKYGSNTAVMVLAFVAIMVLGNVLVARNSQRWDLTSTKDYSLSEQTIKVLSTLKEPIEITAFFSGQDGQRQKVQDLLKEYTTKSDKISVEFIDPDIKPSEAQRFQIRDYATLVFQSGSRRQDVTGVDESDITSAILKVISTEQKKIAFLTGHGERAIDGFDGAGYGQIKQLLDQNNYKVETINLTTNPALAGDVAVLIVASPRTALLDHEKTAIKRYLDDGGRLLLLLDSNIEVSQADVNLGDLIEKWGLEISKGTAFDQSISFLGDVRTLVFEQYRWSPITKDLRAMAVMALATGVTIKTPSPEGVTVTPLLEITDKGWVEMDQRVAKFDEGIDTNGPVPLAVAVEERKTNDTGETQNKPKLVVFGDADFAANGFIGMGANPDLLVNSVNWLTQSEQMVSIKPKQPVDRSLILTTGQGNFILFSSAVLLPGIVLVAGAAVWWRRR